MDYRHVMRLEESDSAQRLICTKPGRNGDVGEADQSWGGAKRYRRTTQGFAAEIGEVTEAHWGDHDPPRDVVPVEEEEENENISCEERGYDTVNWTEACDSSLEWEVFVVMAVMYLVKGRHEICETSRLGRGAVEFFAVLSSYAA